MPSCDAKRRLTAVSDLERVERLRDEQILWREQSLRQTLFVGIAEERRQRLAIRLDAVRPEVVAHLAARVLEVRDQPRQHRLERGRLGEIRVGGLLRGPE